MVIVNKIVCVTTFSIQCVKQENLIKKFLVKIA